MQFRLPLVLFMLATLPARSATAQIDVCHRPEIRSLAAINRYNAGDANHQIVAVIESEPARWITTPQSFSDLTIACHMKLVRSAGGTADGTAFFTHYVGPNLTMTGWQPDQPATATPPSPRYAADTDPRRPSNPKWVELEQIHGSDAGSSGTLYIDAASITVNGNIVTAWRILDFVQFFSTIGGSSIDKHQYACSHGLERSLHVVFVEGHMGTGRILSENEGYDKWEGGRPWTGQDDDTARKVCGMAGVSNEVANNSPAPPDADIDKYTLRARKAQP